MKRLISVVLTLAMIFSLAACGNSGTAASESTAAAAETAAAEEAEAPESAETEAAGNAGGVEGDNIVIWSTYDMPALGIDPSTCFNYSMPTLMNVYDTLLRYNYESDSIEYAACDSYEASEDGLTWKFHIREGMTFHDGTPVNAEAAKFSFERTVNMGKGASYIWAMVESFEVEDEYTLVMKCSYPAAMDLVCCSPYAAYLMSPTAVGDAGEEFFAQATDAGSGPYKIIDRTGDSQVVLEAYDGYWKPFPENGIKTVVISQAAETSTRRQMLEGGEADFVWELPAEDNDALEQNPNITRLKTPSFDNLVLMINTQMEPLNDERVRQALNYAFPYDDVIDYVMNGNATQAVGTVPTGLWGHSDDILQYKYDIDKAKELLTEAGYPDGGFTLDVIYVTGDETERKIAELYQSELSKLGITLDIRPLTSDMYVEKGQNADPAERPALSFLWWYPDVPSPYTFLYTYYHTSDPVSWNWTYADDAELDKMMDDADAISATDRNAANEQFVAAQQYAAEKAYLISIFDKQNDIVYNSAIEGFRSDPSYSQVIFFNELSKKQ